jgi:hypothetical protein
VRLGRNHSRPTLFHSFNHESMVAQPLKTSDLQSTTTQITTNLE